MLNAQTPTHSKTKLIYTSSFILIIGLMLLNIFLSGRTLTISSELKLQEQRYAELQKEKEILTLSLSQHNSIKDIEAKAVAAGYISISQTIAVKSPTDNAVASR